MLTQTGVRRLVGKVCRDHRVPVPAIEFGNADCAGYHPITYLIILPTTQWVKKYRDELFPGMATTAGYRLVVLHELAHLLVGTIGHPSTFYATLFRLCRKYGVPLGTAFTREALYKPRAAAKGIEQYIDHLTNQAKCGTLGTDEAHSR